MASDYSVALTDSVNLQSYPTPSELAEALADTVARQLRRGIEVRGTATLAVSGGNTPKAFLQALSLREVPWHRVVVTLVDERWVGPDHPDSNARLIRENLLQNRAVKARFMPLKSNHDSPFEAVAELTVGLSELLPFDALVLGMGEDGHTASFFPGADTLEQALDMGSGRLCVAVRPPVAPHHRMTLSLPALLNSRFVALHFEGKNKWRVFQRALGLSSRTSYPVAAVLRQTRVPVNVYYTGEQ